MHEVVISKVFLKNKIMCMETFRKHVSEFEKLFAMFFFFFFEKQMKVILLKALLEKVLRLETLWRENVDPNKA